MSVVVGRGGGGAAPAGEHEGVDPLVRRPGSGAVPRTSPLSARTVPPSGRGQGHPVAARPAPATRPPGGRRRTPRGGRPHRAAGPRRRRRSRRGAPSWPHSEGVGAMASMTWFPQIRPCGRGRRVGALEAGRAFSRPGCGGCPGPAPRPAGRRRRRGGPSR